MDVPFQDSTGWELQEAKRERERERQLLALQTIHPVNIIMQCTKKPAETEYMGGFAEIL